MDISIKASSDSFPNKNDVSFSRKLDSIEAVQTPSDEKVAASDAKVFPQEVDAQVYSVANEKLAEMSEQSGAEVLSKMFVPEGKEPIQGINYHKVTREVDTFRTLSKEGFYQKWIQAVNESTNKEIEVERMEKNLKEYRQLLKERFYDYLKEIQQNR